MAQVDCDMAPDAVEMVAESSRVALTESQYAPWSWLKSSPTTVAYTYAAGITSSNGLVFFTAKLSLEGFGGLSRYLTRLY